MTTFGEEIRKLRVERLMTLSKVAGYIGISVSKLCDIEKGRRKPFTAVQLNSFVELLELNENEVHSLRKLSSEGKRSIEIDINSTSKDFNELVYGLAREASSGSVANKDEKWKKILEILESDN